MIERQAAARPREEHDATAHLWTAVLWTAGVLLILSPVAVPVALGLFGCWSRWGRPRPIVLVAAGLAGIGGSVWLAGDVWELAGTQISHLWAFITSDSGAEATH